jgi:hypothetical protein
VTPRERLRAATVAVPVAYRAAAVAVLAVVVSCVAVLESVHRAEERVTALITGAVERNEQRLALLEARLVKAGEMAEGRVVAVVERSALDTQGAVLGTRRQVSALDATYRSLLEAQKRRTLEGLFEEDALLEWRKEAAAAFAAGRYINATRLYGEIAAAHAEDREARFYQYYALFLSNRQDRDQYRRIVDAFTLLERQGYTRRELTETLAFIVAESGDAGNGGADSGNEGVP